MWLLKVTINRQIENLRDFCYFKGKSDVCGEVVSNALIKIKMLKDALKLIFLYTVIGELMSLNLRDLNDNNIGNVFLKNLPY